MLSSDNHHPPKAQHIRPDHLNSSATSPLPALSECRTLHRHALPLSRSRQISPPRLCSHARPCPHSADARHGSTNCQIHPTHKRWLLLRRPRAIPGRDLAHGPPRAPYPRPERLQPAADLHIYIANNPARKNFPEDYPHIHTHMLFSERLDSTPPHLAS